jgi:hypothetical protein
MNDPELGRDEEVLARAQAVHVKSISFEAVLTSKRIILVDKIKNLLPPKEIPLATLKDVEPGENAIRDQIMTLTIFTKTGDTRQMVLTFSREGGGNRKKERDEWIRLIKDHLTPSLEQVIRKVIPGFEPASKIAEHAESPKIEVVGLPVASGPVPDGGGGEARPAADTTPLPELSLGIYCTRCGNRLPDRSEFCNYCGAKIIVPGEVPPVPMPQPPAIVIKKERPIDREIQSIELLIQKSMEKVPVDPLRAVPPEPPAQPPVSPPETPADAAQAGLPSSPESPSTPAPVPVKPTGKRFIPRLFSPKELHPTPLVPESMQTAGPQEPRQPKSKKMLFIAAGIVVIILIIAATVVLVVPMIGSGTASTSGTGTTVTATPVSAQSAPSSGAVVVAETTAIAIPQTGVWVHVDYLGGWKGTYGMLDTEERVTSSGDRVYEIENATGSVTASFWKLDGSSHDITVEIYKDGQLLSHGVTSARFGKVTLSVDTTTGIAQAPVISGDTGTSVTVATTTSAVITTAAATVTGAVNTT